MFSELQKLHHNPESNAALCLKIQLRLVEKIIYVEKRISKLKDLKKSARRRLRASHLSPLSKETAQEVKRNIQSYNQAIEDYHNLLKIFRDVGDGLAFSYISKWDIKTLAIKEAPAALSGKTGGRLERNILRGLFSAGQIAILNDITNSLRYGDITIVDETSLNIIEVKSGNNSTPRTVRQLKNIERVIEYFKTDETDSLYGIGEKVKRISTNSIEVDHCDLLNQTILQARSAENHMAYAEPEAGLLYLCFTEECAKNTWLEVIKKYEGDPLVSLVNHSAYISYGYVPFTISVTDPEALYMFYTGELNIVILIDTVTIHDKFASMGIESQFLRDDKNYQLIIKSFNKYDEPITTKISHHFFQRMFTEFLSLQWFIDSVVALTKALPHNLVE